MSRNNKDTTRNNINVLGTRDQIFGFETQMNPSDLYLMLPATLVGLVAFRFGSEIHGLLGLAMFPTAIALAGAYIYICPSGVKPHNRLASTLKFWVADKDLSTDYEDDSKRSDTICHVDYVRPELDATERDDGALVNGVAVDSSSLSLATEEKWEEVVDDYEQHLNSVKFPTQTTVGGRTVDPTVVTDGLEERLTDPDVRDIEPLKEVIRAQQEEIPVEFKRRGTSVRTTHVNVPVTRNEAQLDDHEGIDKLGELAYVGGLIRALGGTLSQKSDEHVVDEQSKILDRRLQTIVSGFLDVGNCTPEMLTGDQHAAVLEEFWSQETPGARNSQSAPDESRFSDAIRDRDRAEEIDVTSGETDADEQTDTEETND